ncbi:hypothetical protein EXS70_00670 [Candidatus Peribacteria bacterium]|nr:hypothetical protein [Candidatus Peribacteria bacterium]
MKFLNEVVALAEKGVNPESHLAFGFHGTSIQAIKYLAQTGYLPNSGCCRDEFHLCPTSGTDYQDGPLGEAQSYARIHAVRNSIIQEIKNRMPEIDDQFLETMWSMCECPKGFFNVDNKADERIQARLQKILKTPSTVILDRYIHRLVCDKQGLVISLIPEITNLKRRKGLDEDVVVDVPKGLPMRYISGIEPQGQFEWDEILKNGMENVELVYKRK